MMKPLEITWVKLASPRAIHCGAVAEYLYFTKSLLFLFSFCHSADAHM